MALSQEVQDQVITELANDPEFQQASPAQQGHMARVRIQAMMQAGPTLETALPNKPPVPNPKNESLRSAPSPVPSWQQDARDIIEPIMHYGPEIAGAAYGGMRGAQLGTTIAPLLGPLAPAAPVIGGVAGAVMGGTSGRLSGRGLSGVTGIMPPSSAEDAISEIRAAVPENLAGEGMGKLMIGGAKLGGTAIRRMLRGADPTAEQMRTFQEAGEHGITIRPADLTENVASTRVERMVRGSQGGSDIFRRTDMRNRDAFKTMLTDDMAQQSAAMSPQQRGEMITAVLEKQQIPQYQEMARRNYDELRHITAGEKVVLPKESFALVQDLENSIAPDVNPKVAGIVKQIKELIGRPGQVTGLTVTKAGDDLTGSVAGAGGRRPQLSVEEKSAAPLRPKPLDFSEAHAIRSMLGDLGSTGETLSTRAQGISKNIWSMLGHEMEQGAITFQQKTGVPILPKWKAADAFVKEEGHQVFDSAVIKGLLKANPEDVVRSTLKENGITEAHTVVKALQSDKEALGVYRAGVTQELLRRAVNPQTGELTGQSFFKQANMIGDDALKEIYGDRWPTVQKFLRIAKDIDPRAAAGTSISFGDQGMLVWMPAGAVLGALTSGNPYPIVAATGVATAWLIGTKQIAAILNDPIKSRQLLRAASVKPNTEGYLRAVGQLLSTTAGEN